MDDAAQGFRIGGAFHAWGTLFNTLAPGVVTAGYASTELTCPSAYAFATVSVAITAPRPDRPVMGLAYELAASGAAPKEVFAQLVIRLGAPTEVSREEENAGDPNGVVLYAQWARGEVALGLSLYGAPRPSDHSDGIGVLYLTWDTTAAAAPFIDAWRAANADLALAAASAADMQVFTVAHEIPAQLEPRCLHHPEILATPDATASRLGPTNFALWRNADGMRWHLSTIADSIVLGAAGSSTVQVIEIEPARGGGYAAIIVGAWSVRDSWRSHAIADAAGALEKVPGLIVTRHRGYDV